MFRPTSCLRALSIPVVMLTLISGGGGDREIAAQPLRCAVRWTLHQHGDLAPVSKRVKRAAFSGLFDFLENCEGSRVLWDRRITCTDEPISAGGEAEPGRRRTFEKLSTKITSFENRKDRYRERSVSLSSRLEGRRVAWRSVETDSPLEVAFEDDGPEDDWLLEGLSADPEPLGLLPPKRVRAGDRWRVDLEALSGVLLPGGDARIREVALDELDDPLLHGSVLADLARDAAFLGGDRRGVVWATYCGEVTSEGRRLGQIDLELSCELTGKLGKRFRRMAAPAWEWAPVVFGEQCFFDSRLWGDGRLFWDLESGRLESLELNCKTESEIEIPFSMELRGTSREMVIQIALEGYLDCVLALEEL